MPVDAGPTPKIFRLAVEASPSGMIAVNGDGAIIMINGEIERLFGYARDELLGRPVDILLPEEARAKHVIQRSGYMLRPGARRMGIGREFLGRRKDGGQFPIEIGLNSIRIDSCVPEIGLLRWRWCTLLRIVVRSIAAIRNAAPEKLSFRLGVALFVPGNAGGCALMAMSRHFFASSTVIADAGVPIEFRTTSATAADKSTPFKMRAMGLSRWVSDTSAIMAIIAHALPGINMSAVPPKADVRERSLNV